MKRRRREPLIPLERLMKELRAEHDLNRDPHDTGQSDANVEHEMGSLSSLSDDR